MTNTERRIHHAEMRVVNTDGKPPVIRGYAAVYEKPSEDMGFIETLQRGAFKNVLSRTPDVRCLIDHEGGLLVLGRTTSGTLKLWEDETGLGYECTPPDTTAGRDILTLIGRGDINQCSFAFSLADNGDTWTLKDGTTYRTISEIGELFDVSPVTYPAYPDTTVAVRKLEQLKMTDANWRQWNKQRRAELGRL